MPRPIIILLCVCAALLPGKALANAEAPLLFTGQILDGGRQPVAGAEIYVFDSANVKRPADYISEKTGSNGRFRMQLPPGRYWTMAVQRLGGGRVGPLAVTDRYSGAPLVFEGEGGQEVSSDFALMELKEAALLNRKRNDELIRVTGRILDNQGQPVAMAYALADFAPRGEWPAYLSTWTEDDGRYTIFLPRGKIFLGASRTFPFDNGYRLHKEVDFATDAVAVDLLVEVAVVGQTVETGQVK